MITLHVPYISPAKKSYQDFSNFVNGASKDDVEDFLWCLKREHRTVQQSMFRLFMQCCKQWAEEKDENYLDGRNEMAVEKSKEIIDTCFPSGVNVPRI